MIKLKALAFVTVLALAGSTAFAGKECCAGHNANNMKGACEATFANLNLTAAQKTKMLSLAEKCDKGGCTKESMTRMEKDAKRILSKEQFTAWQAACSGKMAEKTQS